MVLKNQLGACAKNQPENLKMITSTKSAVLVVVLLSQLLSKSYCCNATIVSRDRKVKTVHERK